MRRWITNTARLLLAAGAAACSTDAAAPLGPGAPRRTETPLAIEIAGPSRVGQGQGCYYYASPSGGTGTYNISWSGISGYEYDNGTRLLGWIYDHGYNWVEVTVTDGSGQASAGKWVQVQWSATSEC